MKTKSRLKNVALSGCTALALMMSTSAYAQAINIDLPAQPLADALRAVAQQADTNIIFAADAVAGKKAPALKGRFTSQAAVEQLLRDSGLRYEINADRTIIIRAADDAAMHEQPATAETQLAVQEREAPFEAAASMSVSPAAAGETEGTLVSQEIVVTGSRLKGSGEGPAAVVIFDTQAIERSGASQVRDVLRLLPQASTAFDESGAQGFLGAAPPQLRGLSPGSTLMLLNGRRLTVSGSQFASDFFDLSQIPLAAIDRIEVLTDTASAIYGADAVGGAINIRLKSSYEGIEASGRTGTSYTGDASEAQASLVVGGGRGIFSGMLVASTFWRDPVEKSDRALTANSDFTRFGGSDLRSTLSFPGNVYALDGGPLPGLANSFAGIPANPTGRGLTPADFGATDGRLNLFEPAPYVTLIPDTRRQSVYASGSLDFDEHAELYGEILYSKSKQTLQLAPDALFGGEFGQFTVAAGNPYNPFGVDVGVDYRLVDLGARTLDADTEFRRFVVGVRGDLFAGFDYDLSFLSDRDKTDLVNGNLIDAVRVQEALASTDPSTALNLFSTAGIPPALLARLRRDRRDDYASEAEAAELVLRGSLLELPAGPVQIAFGGNARWERIDVEAPDVIEIAGKRDSQAVFAELALPLVSPDMDVPLVASLDATAAVRYDSYGGGVDTTNPQVGVMWRPVRSLTVRGTYGEAFKIPSLYNLFSPSIAFTTPLLDPLRGNEVANVEFRAGGNPDIEPERAKSWTLGLRWAPVAGPMSGFSAETKLFHVRQSNFVQPFLDPSLVLANPDIFADRISRAAPTAEDTALGRPGRLLSVDARSGNFGQVTVEGIDVEVGYTRQTRYGDVSLRLLGSYIDKYALKLIPGSPAENVVDIANESGFPIDFKANAVLSWDHRSGFGATLTTRYRDSYKDFDRSRTLPSQTLFDLQLRFDGDRAGAASLRGWSASIGAINLTNKQADFANSPHGYDPSQVDMRGRFYYLELSKKF